MLMMDSSGCSATNSSDGCMQVEEDDAQKWGRSRGLPGRGELHQGGCTVRVAMKLGRMERAQE